jgi:hypothetical protein
MVPTILSIAAGNPWDAKDVSILAEWGTKKGNFENGRS